MKKKEIDLISERYLTVDQLKKDEDVPTLTDQQIKFCEVYVIYGNRVRAAREAGYTDVSLYTASTNLLQDPRIIKHVSLLRKHLEEELCNKIDVTAEKTIGLLWHMAVLHHDKDPKNAIAAIAEINKMLGRYTAKNTRDPYTMGDIKDIREIQALYVKEF